MKAIEAKDLSFSYGANKVIDRLNMAVEVGDFAAIIGSNGSGKTTLMKLILGELEPDSGSVEIMGKKVHKNMAMPFLRYVPQIGLGDKSNFPANCYEVVSTGIYKGLGKKLNQEDRKAIEKVFELVDLQGLEKRNIAKLSGGQRQRVLLARALVSKPDILMLDEPTAGVDSQTTKKFYQLLKKICDEDNITIVNITHDLEKIHHFTNRVFCLGDTNFHELDGDEISLEVAGKHHHPA